MPSSLSSSTAAVAAATTQQSTAAAAPLSLSLTTQAPKKKLKGGLTLVYDAGEDGMDELCMEEQRASLGRYQKLMKAVTSS